MIPSRAADAARVDVFRQLGGSIERRWTRYGCEPKVFPDLAAQALLETDAWQSVVLEDVVDWILSRKGAPPLGNNSDVPITVYASGAVVIQLLLRFNKPTAIHQHQFSGAWGVILGSSCHLDYTFALSERLAPQLAIGDLRLKRVEHLTAGSVRLIAPGNAFIHALVHLHSPSMSVVIRTRHDPAYEPYNFFSPGLAFDPWFAPEPLRTKIALLRTINRVQPDLFEEAAAHIVESGDLWAAQSVIRLGDKDRIRHSTLANLLSKLRTRHAGLAEKLSAALRWRDRQYFTGQAMAASGVPDLRFFLALLLHVPNRQAIEALVRERCPEDQPQEKLAEWFTQLVRLRSIEFDSPDPGALLRFAMEGLSFDEAATRLECSDTQKNSAVRADWHKLQLLEWLQPLFTDASSAAAA